MREATPPGIWLLNGPTRVKAQQDWVQQLRRHSSLLPAGIEVVRNRLIRHETTVDVHGLTTGSAQAIEGHPESGQELLSPGAGAEPADHLIPMGLMNTRREQPVRIELRYHYTTLALCCVLVKIATCSQWGVNGFPPRGCLRTDGPYSRGGRVFPVLRPWTIWKESPTTPLHRGDRRQLEMPAPVASLRSVTETSAPGEQCLSGKTHRRIAAIRPAPRRRRRHRTPAGPQPARIALLHTRPGQWPGKCGQWPRGVVRHHEPLPAGCSQWRSLSTAESRPLFGFMTHGRRQFGQLHRVQPLTPCRRDDRPRLPHSGEFGVEV